MGLSFTIAAGLRQRSHSQVLVLRQVAVALVISYRITVNTVFPEHTQAMPKLRGERSRFKLEVNN
jgi:hypothetical protein